MYVFDESRSIVILEPSNAFDSKNDKILIKNENLTINDTYFEYNYNLSLLIKFTDKDTNIEILDFF